MPGNMQQAVLECGCCGNDCCYPRCEPLKVVSIDDELVEVPGDCANPLPETLDVTITATFVDSSPTPTLQNCFNGSGTLTFLTPLSTPAGTFCWEGDVSGSCTVCNGTTFNWSVRVVLCCDATTGNHTVQLQPTPGAGMLCPAEPLTGVNEEYECNPFRVTGCWPAFGACYLCLPPNEPPVFTLCYEITE
jgi:hypothetical protein